MDCYIISPIKNLELMELGDRIFVLAQLYLKSEKYRDFVKRQKELGKFITLDNGAGDFDLVTEEALFECVEDLLPNEVVAPDVLFDKEQTLKNFHSFREKLSAFPDVNLFGCPQGDTFWDWLDCYLEMSNYADVIGLSKITIPWVVLRLKNDRGIAHSRNLVYSFLKERDLIKKPIHLLGAGEPWEFSLYYEDRLMRSTDSCFTVWSAMNGISFEKNFERIPTPKDYFYREVQSEAFSLAMENVKYLKKMFKTKPFSKIL